MNKCTLVIRLAMLAVISALIVALIVLPACKPPNHSSNIQTFEEFEAYLDKIVAGDIAFRDKAAEIPAGLSVVIVHNHQVVYASGFGLANGPQGVKAAPETVYMWWSMTKMVTATAIMQLYDQGLIDLDAPVSGYLEYFPAEQPITVRQLLNHSAGLPTPDADFFVEINLDGEPLLDSDNVARAYCKEFTKNSFEPGTSAAYSNKHYLLLGQIVSEVSGQPYTEYVEENILTPLGMDNTDFTYSGEAMVANAAASAVPADDTERFVSALDMHRGLGDGADFIRKVDDQYTWIKRLNCIAASGGLIGSTTDAIRFVQMHLNGGKIDGAPILSPESIALMQEMQLSTNGDPLGFGLGWFVEKRGEHPYVEHGGSGWFLGATMMRLYPDDGLGIVIMGNTGPDYGRKDIIDAAANVIFTTLAE
jgi:CubicO group peptidase (beta-lactamase class C family)